MLRDIFDKFMNFLDQVDINDAMNMKALAEKGFIDTSLNPGDDKGLTRIDPDFAKSIVTTAQKTIEEAQKRIEERRAEMMWRRDSKLAR